VPIAPIFGVAISLFGLPLVPAFLVVFFANLAGGAFGFFLGKYFGHRVAVRFFGEKPIKKAEKFFEKWGEFGVFLAAFTPIPFKIAALSAGIFEMNFWKFLAAAAIGRFLHLAAAAAAFLGGVEFLKFLF